MSNDNGQMQALAPTPPTGMGLMGMKLTPANMEMVAKQVTLQMVKVQMALAMPRDAATVQSELLRYCSNPDFARAAVYAKPVGVKKAYGLSARFAEAAMPVMRNLYEETTQIYDDAEKQTWRVLVGDLETNSSFSEEVFVNKRVWRKSKRRDQDPVQTRHNNDGEINYLYEATDDEVNTLRAALCSKVRRNLIIRHVPPDIRAKCLAQCLDIADRDDARDPDAARKQIVDSFLKIGIGADDLAAYLGHSIRSISPTELAELRGVYVVIRDGEATWSDLLAEKQIALADARKSGGLNKVKENVRRQQQNEGRGKAAPPPPTGDAPPTGSPPETKGTDTPPAQEGRRRASRRRNAEAPETTESAQTNPSPPGTTATKDEQQQSGDTSPVGDKPNDAKE